MYLSDFETRIQTLRSNGVDHWFAVAAALGRPVERLPDFAAAGPDQAAYTGPRTLAGTDDGLWAEWMVAPADQWLTAHIPKAPTLAELIAHDAMTTAAAKAAAEESTEESTPPWWERTEITDADQADLINTLSVVHGRGNVRVDNEGNPVVHLPDGSRMGVYQDQDGKDWSPTHYMPGWGRAHWHGGHHPRIAGVLEQLAELRPVAASITAPVTEDASPLVTWLTAARAADVMDLERLGVLETASGTYVYSPYGEVWLRLEVDGGVVSAVALRPDRARGERFSFPPEAEEARAAVVAAAAERSPRYRAVREAVREIAGDAGTVQYLPRRSFVLFTAPDEGTRDRVLAVLNDRGWSAAADYCLGFAAPWRGSVS